MREWQDAPTGFQVEVDVEYSNGWRETVALALGEPFTMPFDGKIVAWRVV